MLCSHLLKFNFFKIIQNVCSSGDIQTKFYLLPHFLNRLVLQFQWLMWSFLAGAGYSRRWWVICTCWGGGDFGTVASLSFSFNQCAAGCGRFTRRLNLCCGMQNWNRLSQCSVSVEVYIQEKNLQRTRLWIGGWISLKKQVLLKSENLLAVREHWKKMLNA